MKNTVSQRVIAKAVTSHPLKEGLEILQIATTLNNDGN